MTEQPTNCITLHESGYEPGQEVIRIDKEGFHYRGQFISDVGEAHRLMVEFLRQQTQPEPQGPTDEELLDLGSDVMGDCLPCDHDLLIAFARAILARWGRPAIEPVPVAERLPGPEDCDADGIFWVWDGVCLRWDRAFLDAAFPPDTDISHWLPHHALPVPQQKAE